MEFNYWLFIIIATTYLVNVLTIKIWKLAALSINKGKSNKKFRKEIEKTEKVAQKIVFALFLTGIILGLYFAPVIFTEDQEELTRMVGDTVKIDTEKINQKIKEKANESLVELKQADKESADEYNEFLQGIKK